LHVVFSRSIVADTWSLIRYPHHLFTRTRKLWSHVYRWVWENKKTHLKQAGHYVCKELTEEELAEMEYDEESGPPKPQAPLWKGLVWNPDGMTFVDPPTAPAVEAVEPDTAPVEVEAKAEADAAPAEAEAAAAPAESSEGASAPAEEEAKPAEA
jgi:hypothetical protein